MIPFLLAALLLPTLFWDKGPEQASLLRESGVHAIAVPAGTEAAWKGVAGFSIKPINPAKLTKLPAPGVNFRAEEASATRQPWIISNAWHIIRSPKDCFYYDVPGEASALAAAEAYTYNADAVIRTDAAGLKALTGMLRFLQALPAVANLEPSVNIGYQDDGSPASGEFMNLLVRRNLLFKLVSAPDPKLDFNVKLGTPEYPMKEAGNPSLLAEKVRANLTDEKRLLRIYGTYTVIGRLLRSDKRARVLVLNYAQSASDVDGVRIRVLGDFPHHSFANYGLPRAVLADFKSDEKATEFTITKLGPFAIIDLTR